MGGPMATPIGGPTDSSECYGRTDGPTKNPLTNGDRVSVVDAGAHTSIPTIGEVISNGPGLWITDDRHPVIRSGERAEIPSHVRAAVWYRDRGKCELCGTHCPPNQPWHLDHITPWSAGGSDQTTNLRVLCERHNIDRSNKIDPTERPRRAATWWCSNCHDLDRHAWEYYQGGLLTCPIHGSPRSLNKSNCRVQRNYWRVFNETGQTPTWHDRPGLTSFDQIAYCAHCDAPGMTGRVL